jgi:hypothetical protein
MATDWPFADEIDASNDDLVVAITEVIASNKMPTKNHLISSIDTFGLNPNCGKERWVPSPSYLRQMAGEEEEEEP